MIIDGKKISAELLDKIAAEVQQLKKSNGKVPHLAAVLVGNNGASETYVGAKVKACEKVGFKSSLIRFPESITEQELLIAVRRLNEDKDIDGFIVQLPLPKHIAEQKVIEAISPIKDVDGFHPTNVGRMALNLPTYLPATPYGILLLLEAYNIETSGKHCVVIGRSNIVGSPMSILLARNAYPGNCTVTLTHSKTKNINDISRTADILIVALGKPGFVTSEMVKEGVVIIDVGITRLSSTTTKSGYKLFGDVNYDQVAPKCSFTCL